MFNRIVVDYVYLLAQNEIGRNFFVDLGQKSKNVLFVEQNITLHDCSEFSRDIFFLASQKQFWILHM